MSSPVSACMPVCREYNVDTGYYKDMIQGIRDAYHTLKGRAVLRGILFVQVGWLPPTGLLCVTNQSACKYTHPSSTKRTQASSCALLGSWAC